MGTPCAPRQHNSDKSAMSACCRGWENNDSSNSLPLDKNGMSCAVYDITYCVCISWCYVIVCYIMLFHSLLFYVLIVSVLYIA